MKNKYTTIGVILTTIILAGVAIFTAIRLYQTRTEPVAPNAPVSKPAAQEEVNSCNLSFTISVATTTPTATPASLSCNSHCDLINGPANQCGTGLTCKSIGSGPVQNLCRNSQCSSSSNCICATATSTSNPTATATTTSTSYATATATSTSSTAATSTPTIVATATATVTANPQCSNSCTSNSNCPSDLICYIASGATTGMCRNTQCLPETDCTCAVATATATSTSLAQAPAPTNQPTLPVVGTRWPTILGTGFGILVIIGSLLLAL